MGKQVSCCRFPSLLTRLPDEQSRFQSQTEQILQHLTHGKSVVSRNAELHKWSSTFLNADSSTVHGHWGCITSKGHLSNVGDQFFTEAEALDHPMPPEKCACSRSSGTSAPPIAIVSALRHGHTDIISHSFDVLGTLFGVYSGSLIRLAEFIHLPSARAGHQYLNCNDFSSIP